MSDPANLPDLAFDQWGGLTSGQRADLIAKAQAQYAGGNLPVCVVPVKR